jgi:hypothetical protein
MAELQKHGSSAHLDHENVGDGWVMLFSMFTEGTVGGEFWINDPDAENYVAFKVIRYYAT